MRAVDLTLQQTPGSAASSTSGRFCVFDTETSGLGADHRVVEIGVVEVINRRPTGREFHAYINPERSIDADAERVHGLSARFLADKPKFRNIYAEFIAFLGTDGQLVAHHAGFDINKLNAEFQRIGVSYRIDQQFEIIDTMKLARKLYPGQRASLDALCERLQVSRSERQEQGLHGALTDSRILTRVFLAMTAGQVHFGYSHGRQVAAATGAKLDRAKYGPLKVVCVTPTEESAHVRLCDAIEKSSGGYCGFRGKWSKPEKSAPSTAEAPQAEFGAGTIAAVPTALSPAPVTTDVAEPEPESKLILRAPAVARTAPIAIEFAPSI